MGQSEEIRQIVERVVGETLATHLNALKDELVNRACEQLSGLTVSSVPAAPVEPSAPTPAGGAPTDLLNAAFNSVLDASSQTDILASLLDGASKFAGRVALFVIRGGNASGWRAVGVDNPDAVKGMSIDVNSGLAGRAYHDRLPASASAAEFDTHFVSSFGLPADGSNAIVLPLVIRDKVAALIYADIGAAAGGKLDPSALETLVRSAGLWLEVVSARKSGAPMPAEAPEPPVHREELHAAEPVHAPEPPPAPEVAPPEPEPEPVRVAPPVTAPSLAAAAAAAAPAPAPAASGFSPEDEEIHKKAKRFAKLLVDEIKLYNQAKVAEGRANKDLYARLKDDIDKSRATYEKRYGSTAAASGNYFSQELIRILANGDGSLLGSGFSG
ncbi:MAG: hypothetical protein ACR2IF_07780 [Terriglobales bacterium]